MDRGALDFDFWERADFAGVEDWEDIFAEASDAVFVCSCLVEEDLEDGFKGVGSEMSRPF